MTDCVFCKIINREIPADVIYDCDDVVAFMDIRPVSRGHLLVVPKVHTSNLLETADEILVHFMHDVKKVAEAAQKAMKADGMTISTNIGEAAGQTVFHLHFHIIPRYAKDGLVPWPHRDVEPKTRAELASAIKQELK